MTDMHRASGLQFPKGTPPKVDRETRRRAFVARDRRGSRQARARSGGRCEVVIDFVRCPRTAEHVHHMIKGIGQRGHGISALAERKQHACMNCHDLIERHDVELVGLTVPHYSDTYQTKGRPGHAKKIDQATGC